MAKSKKFPKQIAVMWEPDGDGGSYLIVRENPEADTDIESSAPVALYALASEGVLRVTRKLDV